jgi:hypothetical protein
MRSEEPLAINSASGLNAIELTIAVCCASVRTAAEGAPGSHNLTVESNDALQQTARTQGVLIGAALEIFGNSPLFSLPTHVASITERSGWDDAGPVGAHFTL